MGFCTYSSDHGDSSVASLAVSTPCTGQQHSWLLTPNRWLFRACRVSTPLTPDIDWCCPQAGRNRKEIYVCLEPHRPLSPNFPNLALCTNLRNTIISSFLLFLRPFLTWPSHHKAPSKSDGNSPTGLCQVVLGLCHQLRCLSSYLCQLRLCGSFICGFKKVNLF